MKRLLVLIVSIGFATNSFTQNLTDALRYSYLIPGGTARVIGAGGSFGAMGGDFGSGAINVSGFADFRSNELLFSFSYNNAKTRTLNNGSEIGDNPGREFILENVGYVKHSKPYRSAFKTSNFAIGLQQFANYNQVISYQTSGPGSIVERFAWQANIDEYSAFEAGLADDAGAIFYDAFVDRYLTDIVGDQQINKEQVIERSGRYNELLLAWAGKLKSDFNIGVGIGIPFLSFQEDKFYEENDVVVDTIGFNKLNYNESLSVSGTGVNLKVGIGYTLKLVQAYTMDSVKVNRALLRMGLAFQSPTLLRLEDDFRTSIQYDCQLCEFPDELFTSPDGFFEYRLRTPYRLTGSLGTLLNLGAIKGFVNFDVQYLNYRKNSFNLTSNSDDPADAAYETEVNGDIDNTLNSALNYNLGTELVFNRWRARAGLALLSSPFFDEGVGGSNFDEVISAGIGYRANSIYLDLGYQLRKLTEGYTPYTTESVSRELQLTNNSDISKLVLTFGIKL